MKDLNRLNYKITELVAARCHYFDNVDKVDLSTCKSSEVTNLTSGWRDRYRNDYIFNARVKCFVAGIMMVINEINREYNQE